MSLQADVIVNTTQQDLDLRSGSVSAAILAKAGKGLQDECRVNYPNGLSVGQVASSSPHGLRCKTVFHIALPQWDSTPVAKQV
jgi:O-acetyl-ADP-ribose deacetylase (regulator of RNase III)